mgnify:CR=1 FL=1
MSLVQGEQEIDPGSGDMLAATLRGVNNHVKSKRAKAIAWRAQKRLCGRYRQLSQAGKNIKLVCVAIARELAGFIWDIVRQEMPRLASQRA